MPDMRTLEPGPKQGNVSARVFSLQTGQELHFPIPESHMPETSTSSDRSNRGKENVVQTILVLTLESEGPIPDAIKDVLEARAYDWTMAKGVRVTAADVRVWYSLQVKEAA